ncbi:MAG: hypothetical protein ACW99U_21830 [Candidatus Thorarchaeota archaeon]|jgi:hypothetical protein
MARAEAAQPYFTLDDYRKFMGIPLCAFNGVEDPDETVTKCDHYWTQAEREMVARALYNAEETLALHLRFYIGEHFLTDEDIVWTDPMQLRFGYIVGGGVRGRTEVTPTASDFTTDPATITVTQTDFPGGTSEIVIVEDSTGYKINPDKVTSAGLSYVIEIDQCKLIEWDDLEDQILPIDYDPLFPAATWLKLADLTIYREYLDDSDQATITFNPACDCWCGTACTGADYTGCVWVIDTTISKVRVNMSDYSDGAWTCNYPSLTGCYHGSKVDVNYQAGTTNIPGWKEAIVRLAHTNMIVAPCGCTLFDQALLRDRNIPPVLTTERINCPLGQSDGAWYVWQWLRTSQHGRAFML